MEMSSETAKTMELKNWALKEIDLAKGSNDEAHEYYNAAYLAFCDLLDRTCRLDNPGIAKTIFTQLLLENPLTPIEDNEDDWVFADGFDPASGNENPGWTIYQCKRRSSLFKKVIYDRKTGDVEHVKFSDTKRYVCVDINTEDIYTGGMGPVILDEMFPISMPYSPLDKIKIFTEDFKYHEDFNGDFDTVGVLYFRFPDGKMKQIKRFFKKDHKTHEMKEINITEYLARQKKAERTKNK